MPTTLVDLTTLDGKKSYSEKSYINYEFFKMLYGGSPAEWANRISVKSGENWERMRALSEKFDQDFDYVVGTNLSDECINNQQSGYNPLYEHLGCTSVASGGLIGQTLDLFTVELCIIREPDALYLTFPPYLCVLGMGRHIAMCTNHLFDSVDFSGLPISHIRRSLLDQKSLDAAVSFLQSIRPTTSVNFMLSDGEQAIDVEVTPSGINIHKPYSDHSTIVHTNHILTQPFYQDQTCLRLESASQVLLQGATLDDALSHKDVVQPIANGFGTIITVWMDPKNKILHYKDPGEIVFKALTL